MSLQDKMLHYRDELQKGDIQAAYKSLMEYMLSLKAGLKKRHPDYGVSSTFYFGYMDMSYFALAPEELNRLGLKIAIVFLHKEFRFEFWLAAANKDIQKKYWQVIKESGWDAYHLVPELKNSDSILENIAADQPDFDDPQALTGQIESRLSTFINDIQGFFGYSPITG